MVDKRNAAAAVSPAVASGCDGEFVHLMKNFVPFFRECIWVPRYNGVPKQSLEVFQSCTEFFPPNFNPQENQLRFFSFSSRAIDVFEILSRASLRHRIDVQPFASQMLCTSMNNLYIMLITL